MLNCRLFVLPLLLLAGPALGAPDSSAPTVDLQLFHPTAGANNFFSTESGDVNSHLGFAGGLNLNYANEPLAVRILREGGQEEPAGAIVGYRIDANLLLSFGLFDIGEIGLAMPMILQGGLEDNKFGSLNIDVGAGSLKQATQGDLRVMPKVRALRVADGLLSVAVVGDIVVPLAGGTPYAGENGPVFGGALAVSSDLGFLRLGLNAGYRMRDRTKIEPTPGQVLLIVDDEVYAKFAVAYDLNAGKGAPFEIIGEVYGHTPAVNAFAINNSDFEKDQQMSRTSAEGLLGIRLAFLEHFILTAGAGGGISPQGYGQAKPRIFAGLTYYTGQFGIADGDQDGVPDPTDKCLDKKEDKDGFEDDDGCPDIDNDEDGVLDEDDQCPMEPEGERDGFNDEDGCPDPDNDEDGLRDESDQCPVDAEDKDGFEDEDGCPDLDNDGDGVADKVDECPDAAEDVNGFKDIDGCPDEDNDGDGLPDLGDLCPNHAEDMDGVADDDGCPEDNDNDGIPDADDKCPNKAEIYNGIEDEDGCPEKVKKKSLVRVTDEKIEIKQKVFFKSGSAKLMSKSNDLLDQVAAVIKNYKHLRKIRVEGHTDSRGSRKKNMKLSRERAQAVRQYLLDKGVEPERVEADGFGPDKPIASNRSRRGRDQNRRVEFVIAEQKPIGEDVSDREPVIDIDIDIDAGAASPDEPATDVEPTFDFDAPAGGDEPPAPTDAEPTFDFDSPADDTPAAEPEPSEEPKKGKGKGKKKKKKKKKEAKEETEPEIDFDF